MTFDWCEYLNLARELAGETVVVDPEAKLRSSISRSYYSCFCTTRDFVCDIERDSAMMAANQRRDINMHSFMIDRLRNDPSDRLKRKIGNKLKRLRTNRNIADYEDNIINPQKTADDALNYADDIMSDLNTLKIPYMP
jgi:hypothetical protein